jgi:hypothetical protein
VFELLALGQIKNLPGGSIFFMTPTVFARGVPSMGLAANDWINAVQAAELNTRQYVQTHHLPHCFRMNNRLRSQSPDWPTWITNQQLLKSSRLPSPFGGDIVETSNPIYSSTVMGGLGEALLLPFFASGKPYAMTLSSLTH